MLGPNRRPIHLLRAKTNPEPNANYAPGRPKTGIFELAHALRLANVGLTTGNRNTNGRTPPAPPQ
eukprot:9420449-Lingulodinium_polyedra.AAC.1